MQPPFCALCGDPASGRIDHAYRCAFCVKHPVYFDAARSVARYEGAVASLVQELKYRQAVWVAEDLADFLQAGVATWYPEQSFDAVAFVPLHAARRRARGYNQAAMLAAALARRMRLPLLRRTVFRVRATPTQTKLSATRRAENVHGAFAVRPRPSLKGRRLLLIDDVMTTGATVNEVSRALKDGGASAVHVLTLARG